MSYYVTNENSFLDIKNAHLRVTGNVHTDVLKVGSIGFQPAGSNISGTVNFTNVTTGVTTTSNLNVGGTLNLGTIELSASTHTLDHITARGNVTSTTVQFNNATTGLVTTSNVEVGGELTVSGTVDLLSVSNVASIKKDSNVVTEFPRSKKLIKYPRVALTGPTTGPTSEEYTASASDEQPNYEAWRAFENLNTNSDAWTTDWTENRYDVNNGEATTNTPLFEGEYGDWIQIQLPTKIKLEYIVIDPRRVAHGKTPEASPGDGRIFGSTDGTNWTLITSFSNRKYGGDGSDENASVETVVTSTYVYYNYYRLQVTKRAGQYGTDKYVAIGQLELYGIPEYDPEADGVDVKATSYPNVPNTDWLDIYYDGQDYTSMQTTIDNKTGVSAYDATPINGVGFDATQKAFTFNANSSQYLSSSTPINGNYIHTISMWFKGTNLTSTGGDTLMWVGDNIDNQRIEIYIENDRINYNFRTNDCIAHTTFQNNRWYHLTCTYNGQQGSVGREIYVDGQLLSTSHSGNLADLNITNSTLNVGGFSGTSTTYMFSGFIANFRLFNRALTSDEVWQLYAYQKKDFGHGDLSMTFKAGRLGIGTSEPRAMLDVRGGARLYGINHCSAYKSNSNYVSKGASYASTALSFDTFLTEYGGFEIVNNGGIRIPVSGVYHCYTHAVFTKYSTTTWNEWRTQVEFWVNDTNESNGVDYSSMGRVFDNMKLTGGMEGNRGFAQVVLTRMLVLNAGDILYSKVRGHTDNTTEIDERCNNLQVFMIQAI